MKAQIIFTCAWGVMAVAMIFRILKGDAVAFFIMGGALLLMVMAVVTSVKGRKASEE